eukprot:1176830-Prorocentrum_minimum.AAC.7
MLAQTDAGISRRQPRLVRFWCYCIKRLASRTTQVTCRVRCETNAEGVECRVTSRSAPLLCSGCVPVQSQGGREHILDVGANRNAEGVVGRTSYWTRARFASLRASIILAIWSRYSTDASACITRAIPQSLLYTDFAR